MNELNAIKVARMSDVGRMRERNEDAVASDLTSGLVMIADGMGGYKAGEIASQMATLILTAELAELMHWQKLSRRKSDNLSVSQMLHKIVSTANELIYRTSQTQSTCTGMGTTLVAGVFFDNTITVGHIGDSRLYRLRGGVLEQLTEDHSLLQEQINAGLITKEQAKTSNDGHLVTRALGTDPEVELEVQVFDTKVGDCYLLCSDGLTDLVSDDEISDTLAGYEDINLAANHLVKLANKNGGTDNISVVIAFVKNEFAMKHGWIHKLWR